MILNFASSHFFFQFIYILEKEGEGKRLRESLSPGSLSKCPQGSGARNSVLHGGKALNHLNHPHCLPACTLAGGWNWEWSLDWNPDTDMEYRHLSPIFSNRPNAFLVIWIFNLLILLCQKDTLAQLTLCGSS